MDTIGQPKTNRNPTSAPNLVSLIYTFSTLLVAGSQQRGLYPLVEPHRPRESEGSMAVDGIVPDLSVPIYLPYLPSCLANVSARGD